MIVNRKAISILAAYIGLIYATLPFGPKLFAFLSKSAGPSLKAYVNAGSIALVISLIASFYPGVKRKRLSHFFGFAFILLIYALLITAYTPIIAEKVHLLEYGLLAYIASRAFKDTASSGKMGQSHSARNRHFWDSPYFSSLAVIVAVGYCDELIQGFLPNRVYELRDVYLNVLSGLLGLALLRLLGQEVLDSPDLRR